MFHRVRRGGGGVRRDAGFLRGAVEGGQGGEFGQSFGVYVRYAIVPEHF